MPSSSLPKRLKPNRSVNEKSCQVDFFVFCLFVFLPQQLQIDNQWQDLHISEREWPHSIEVGVNKNLNTITLIIVRSSKLWKISYITSQYWLDCEKIEKWDYPKNERMTLFYCLWCLEELQIIVSSSPKCERYCWRLVLFVTSARFGILDS